MAGDVGRRRILLLGSRYDCWRRHKSDFDSAVTFRGGRADFRH